MTDDRIQWRSRRGMLELDLLLVPFAKERFAGLDAGLQAAYADLLEQDDWQILDWLQERSAVSDSFVDIIRMIREHNDRP